MKLMFKKYLLLFIFAGSVLSCSSDFNPDVPVNSNDLIDQNIVYKEDLKEVEVPNAPSHSLDKKIEDINKEENSEDVIEIVEDKEEVIEDATNPITDKKENAENVDNKVEDKEVKKENLQNSQLKDDEKSENNDMVDHKVLPEDEDMSPDDILKLKEELSSNNDMKVIDVPVASQEDAVIDVVDESYAINDNENNILISQKVVDYDDEFESAVRQAQEKRGIKVDNVKPKNRTLNIKDKKAFKLNVKDDVEEKKNDSITFLSAIVYHSNTKADVSNKDVKALKKVADFIKKHDASVRIVGNSSSRTKNMKEIDNKLKNFDLSLLRAQKVRDVLVKNGVPVNKIFIDAVSDTEKILEENMPINEAVNRRTEIYITY